MRTPDLLIRSDGGQSVEIRHEPGGRLLRTADTAKITDEAQLAMTSEVGAVLILIDVALQFEPVGVWAGE
jgi:hypothetical protein